MANGIYERAGTLFKDGYGFAGQVTAFTPPVIEESMQEFTAGGIGGTIEIPMGKVANMEATWTLKTHSPEAYAATSKNDVSVKYRASAVDQDGSEVAIRYEMRGRITRTEESEKSDGSEGTIIERMHVTSFAKYVNNEEVRFIDIKALIFRVDGQNDIWADMRKSLGL